MRATPADANMAPVIGSGGYAPAQPARVRPRVRRIRTSSKAEDYTPQQPAAPIKNIFGGGQPGRASRPSAHGGSDSGQLGQSAGGRALQRRPDRCSRRDDPPPPLPDYDQRRRPDPNYIWTPGYWGGLAGGPTVGCPGCWVAAPYTGSTVDAGLLGLCGQTAIASHHGFLGAAHRLLRRRGLRLRLRRARRLLRRLTGNQRKLLL